jgi:hypothetical protein
MQTLIKSPTFAAKMLARVQAQEVRASRILGGVVGATVAAAIYGLAYAYQADGLKATFVAVMLGTATFQIFEPVFKASR